MPIYEFYCAHCHRVFNFLSRAVDTTKTPDCPRCGRRNLTRKVSRFAVSRGREESPDDGLPDMDESKLEAAMAALESEAAGLDEDDPRQAARLMRRFTEATGMPLGEGMEEALRRMEAGEDPDAVEEELGELLDADPAEDEPHARGSSRLVRRMRPPAIDDEIYEL
jgi:putative FmdB family regulatory protein